MGCCYVGEAVVAVVAESQAQAVDAAQLVEIEYDELPTAGNLALKFSIAPLVWEDAPNNIVAQKTFGDEATVDVAFAKAHHVTKLELANNRLLATQWSPHGHL